MSNQNNFAGGFLTGAIFGGIVGGIVGAAIVSTRYKELTPDATATPKRKKQMSKAATGHNIEEARQGLEDKIAQLNNAIDDVRQQLSDVNGNLHEEEPKRSFAKDA